MQETPFKIAISISAAIFLAVFFFYVVPASLEQGDIIAAFAAGFVNPFAAGYSTDVIMCWFILLFWILHEQRTLGIKHGWICYVLGAVPGVALGFALYLIMRQAQLSQTQVEEAR